MHSADNTKTLQNTLRLLKLWFNHGSLPEIEQIIREGFDKIDLKVWIHVIPQLLARINIKENVIRNSLNDLLERISQKFPQALIYSLSVTEKSTSDVRKEAAQQLIEKLKLTQNELIEQAT
jgi:FKBP12-rapamycin complex-associated protein